MQAYPTKGLASDDLGILQRLNALEIEFVRHSAPPGLIALVEQEWEALVSLPTPEPNAERPDLSLDMSFFDISIITSASELLAFLPAEAIQTTVAAQATSTLIAGQKKPVVQSGCISSPPQQSFNPLARPQPYTLSPTALTRPTTLSQPLFQRSLPTEIMTPQPIPPQRSVGCRAPSDSSGSVPASVPQFRTASTISHISRKRPLQSTLPQSPWSSRRPADRKDDGQRLDTADAQHGCWNSGQPRKKFQVPLKSQDEKQINVPGMITRAFKGPVSKENDGGRRGGEDELPEKLRGCEPALIERIEQEIIDHGDPIRFEDIAGLEDAKRQVVELVVWPLQQPELFTGLRSLPRGLLLLGPPGTGKTLIGKAIAHQCGATFFNISASSLGSKWIGEGEKLVKTLFALARYYAPSMIFIDEIDSMLCQRSSEENEASRRLKTEFLVQLDGAGTVSGERVLVIGATNRPQELDEAARRRFQRRLYIPLPDATARRSLLSILLGQNAHSLLDSDVDYLVNSTEAYSGADLRNLAQEAAMGPLRDITRAPGQGDVSKLCVEHIPAISMQHFHEALSMVRPTVSKDDLGSLEAWNEQYGTYKRRKSD